MVDYLVVLLVPRRVDKSADKKDALTGYSLVEKMGFQMVL